MGPEAWAIVGAAATGVLTLATLLVNRLFDRSEKGSVGRQTGQQKFFDGLQKELETQREEQKSLRKELTECQRAHAFEAQARAVLEEKYTNLRADFEELKLRVKE